MPQTYFDMANEQSYLRIPRVGQTLSVHGDPHPGNIFVAPKKMSNGSYHIMPTQIDAGFVVERDAKTYMAHLALMTHMLMGDSESIA